MAVCPSCRETNPEVGGSCPRCDEFHYIPEEAVEDAENDPLIGRMTAEKYVILSLINEGGMGAVYRALQMPVEREVAFKVLRTELKDSDNGRDRFIREARAVSRLNHPNIITLYDFGFDNGKHPYMVMEYAPGKSIGKWQKEEKINTERIMRVTAQILSALTEAHSRGIVHRDLKPDNMIVSQRGDQDYVKLLDFGIARMINEGATRGLTREGEVFGTPHYMAPEQAQGKKDLGPPADIYAIGIMMWEMICGECPFDAPTPLAVLFMHINDEIPPLRPRDGVEINADVEHIVRRACAKEPADRYQSAEDMLADIFAVIGFNTAALPGMMNTDPSAEFSLTEGRVTGASHALHTNSSVANRQPHFTPSPNHFGMGVDVNDPDPSLITDYPADEASLGSDANKRLGVIAAIAVLAVIGAVSALIMITASESNEAEGAEAVIQQETNGTPAAVAVKKAVDSIQVEPIEPEAADPELQAATLKAEADKAAAEKAAAEKAAAEKAAAEKAAAEKAAAEKKAADKPKTTTKRVQKKVVQKKPPEKKTSDTTPSTKTEKAKPGKWTVKPKRWD